MKKLDSCEPCLFPDAQTGLAWCSGNAPDPAIVDYMMPACAPLPDGKGPVLMITVNDDKGVRYEALEKGATDFLTKPVDRIEFSARVRNMLNLASSRKKLADKAAWLAEEVEKATAAVYLREQELLFRMSRAAEFRDPETGAHIQRMANYSSLIARSLAFLRQSRS